MDDLTTREAITVPAILTIIMLVVGLTTAQIGPIDWTDLPSAYILAAFGGTVQALLISIFCWVAAMAFHKVENPMQHVIARCKACAPALVFPVLLFPIFLVGFTTAKTAIPFLVGYRWDAFWADADQLIFGNDAWRISHYWLGTGSMQLWAWIYTVVWGAVLVFTKAFVAINSSRRRLAVFYTAMLSTWLFGGWLMAYAFSTAGPIFAHLVEPGLAGRFAELRQAIAANLHPEGLLRSTQLYLAASINDHTAYRGGGISAMPSMHLGATTIYVLAARRGPWFFPAVAFWIVIFVLSGYVGYHYWVDGIAAAGTAWLCWAAAEAYYSKKTALVPSAPQLSRA